MKNTATGTSAEPQHGVLDKILVEALKVFFWNWKPLLGIGLPLAAIFAFLIRAFVGAGYGGILSVLVHIGTSIATVALFSAIWLRWAEEKLDVLRWQTPFSLLFLRASGALVALMAVDIAALIAFDVFFQQLLFWQPSQTVSWVLQKITFALSHSLTGPLAAGWILVGSRMPVVRAIATSLRLQVQFFGVCLCLALVGSLAGGGIGAVIGGLFGIFGGLGSWGLLFIQNISMIINSALFLSFSLIALHRLYPELTKAPHVR